MRVLEKLKAMFSGKPPARTDVPAAEWRAEIAKYEAMARARGIEPAEIYSAAGITRADSELDTILAKIQALPVALGLFDAEPGRTPQTSPAGGHTSGAPARPAVATATADPIADLETWYALYACGKTQEAEAYASKHRQALREQRAIVVRVIGEFQAREKNPAVAFRLRKLIWAINDLPIN